MKLVDVNFNGKKAKCGNITFDTGRLGVFLCYCETCHKKLILTIDEAEQFANKYATVRKTHKNRTLMRMLNNLK